MMRMDIRWLLVWGCVAMAGMAAEYPDAGGFAPDAHEAWDLLRRDIDNWKRLPSRNPDQAVNVAATILPEDKDPLDVLFRRTRALADDLAEAGVDVGWAKTEMDVLAAETAKVPFRDWAEMRFPFFSRLMAVNRKLALSNPLLKGIDRLVFVTHEPKPFDEYHGGSHMCDQYFGFHATLRGASFGDGLYVLENPFSDHPVARDILDGRTIEAGAWKGQQLGRGGYLSPDVSYDGKVILFAYTRGKPDIRKWEDDTVWHIFKCNADGSGLVQLTTGTVNDFDPCWLPNGRVAFISERRGGFGRCHGRPVPTFTLHSMFADGSDIVQLSPHETNEWHPSVNHAGMIVYTRWDYVDRGHSQAHHAWTTTPDGRDPREVNGNTRLRWGSGPLMEMNVRSIPGSQKYVATAAPHHGWACGSFVLIDPTVPDDGEMSCIRRLTPEQPFAESEAGNGRSSGSYATAWPLSEKYYLCVYDGNGNGFYNPPSIRRYSIVLLDAFGNKTRLYTHPTISCLDPIPLRPREMPPQMAEQSLRGRPADADGKRPEPIPDDQLPKTALIGLMNVYNAKEPFPEGTVVKALRVWQVLPKIFPINGEPRLGGEYLQVARQCLGTVPVESDGSAYFEAPVDVPLYFQALDGEGRCVQNMRSDTYVKPGERLMCNGCHERRPGSFKTGTTPTPLAVKRAPSKIAPAIEGSKPFSYPRLVQPVLDAKCVKCHGEKRDAKAPDLRAGDWRKNPMGLSTSYMSLRPYVHFFTREYQITHKYPGGGEGFQEPSYSLPCTTGALGSPLYQMLRKGHHDVALTEEEWARLILWMDSNAQYIGHDHKPDDQRDGKVVEPIME